MTETRFRARAFGRLEVEGDLGPIDLGGPRPRTVLAVLLVEAGRIVSTDRLVEETWGESPPSGARRTLQAYVAGLRRALGGDDGPLRSESHGYRLETDGLEVDLDRFEALARHGRERLAGGDVEAASELLRRALDLWVDEPFADLPADDVPTLAIERVRLSELRLTVIEARVEGDLALGRYRDLVPELETLVAAHPERESLWTKLMVALHESGRSAEALRAGDRLRRYLVTELGLEPSAEVRQLEHRISSGDRVARRAPITACPYKGLRTYEPEDAELFFGREQLVDQLVARLVDRALVAVVGASGTGKSSLVRAGLVPALRGGALPGPPWAIKLTTPGPRPSEALRLPVADPGMRRLLIVDQLEEVFTLCQDAVEQHRFLDRLVEVASLPQTAVVVVARADVYGHFADHPRCAALVPHGTVLVGPMSATELEQTVVGPAERVGLRVEPALREAVLADAGGEAGVLPLVSHALVETWARRDGTNLTLAGYMQAGGAAGALAQTAEAALHHQVAPAHQDLARDLLLRLVEPAREGPDTRRTVALDELVMASARESDARAVIEVLADARLLTVDDAGVRLTHEAVLRAWPTFREWLDVERHGLLVRRQLTEDASRWERGGRDAADLVRGVRLSALMEWREKTALPLTESEGAFVDASAAFADRQGRETEERIHQQVRANRRLRRMVGVTLAALVAAAVLGAVALRQRDRAEANAEAAVARQLAAEVDMLIETDLDLALLVAAESLAVADRAETRRALLDAIGARPRLRRLVPIGPAAWSTSEVSLDGRWLVATTATRSVVIVSLEGGLPSGAPIELPPAPQPAAEPRIAIRPDGSMAAVHLADGRVWLVDGGTGQRVGPPISHGIHAGAMTFSPDGERLAVMAVTGPREVFRDPAAVPTASLVVIDPTTGERRGPELVVPDFDPTDLAFGPDGSTLAAVNSNGSVRVWRWPSGTPVTSFVGPAGASELAIDDAGSRIAVIGQNETRVFGARTGRLLAGPLAHEQIGEATAFAPDGRLVTGSGDGWRIWDLNGPRQQGPAVTAGGPVDAIEVTEDGTIITANREGRVVMWSPDPLPVIATRLAIPFGGAFDPQGSRLAAIDPAEAGTVSLHDLATGREVWRVTGGEAGSPVERLAWSPEGDRIAMTTRVGELMVLSADDGTVESGPHHLEDLGVSGFGTDTADQEAARVVALDLSQNGQQIALATSQGELAIVDLDEGALADLIEVGDAPGALTFLDDQHVLVGGSHGVVTSVDLASRETTELLRLDEPVDVHVLAKGPGGLVVAGGAGVVTLWDPDGRSRRLRVDAGAAGVQGVALSPDGRWLAATLETGQTKLFDATTGAPAGALGAERSVVAWPHDTAFDPTGDRVHMWDNQSYVTWEFDPAAWQAAACELAGRPLSEPERARYLAGLIDEPVCGV